jgi:iron complex outermembrane recepter protein
MRFPVGLLRYLAMLACPGALALLAPSLAAAQDAPEPPRLPTIEVTGTREGGRSPMDVPFAVTRVTPDSLRPGQSRTSIDEILADVPGVLSTDRANPAQDPRISIRGFGARSAFGVRALHVRRDGLPLTMPDGQTAIDAVELESVESVEVIRGPASSIYGNAAGGVIELHSRHLVSQPVTGWGRAVASSHWNRLSAGTIGGSGPIRHQVTLSRRSTSGPREYASATATGFHGRAAIGGPDRTLTLVTSLYDLPWADAPGALTLEELESDPTLADPAGIRRRAGKEVRQRQAGLVGEWRLGKTELAATLHGLTRAVRNPLPFRVVDFDRVALGTGFRATQSFGDRGRPHLLSGGFDFQRQDDDRYNYANCADTIMPAAATANCPRVGDQRGQLLLDQRELVSGLGIFTRGDFAMSERLRGSVGVRFDRISFGLRDRFLSDERDDSGSRVLAAVSPAAGLNFRAGALHSLYGNIAMAFETPTTTELTNQPDGSAGMNRELSPQRSLTAEIGARGYIATLWYDIALYSSRIDDELVPFEVPGGAGRRYFRNAGRTSRRGGEAALDWSAGISSAAVRWGLVYTRSAFRYDDYEILAPSGNVTSFTGNRVPGVPEHQLRARTTLIRGRWFLGGDAVMAGRSFADDANTVSVDGYTVVNIRLGAIGLLRNPSLSPAIEFGNVFDARYTPSIVINAQGGRFYEPAPGRRLTISLSADVGRGG